MKPTTKLAIAQLLASAGAVLSALAAEFGAEAPATPEAAAQPEAPAKPKKTKEKPAQAAPTPQPEPETEPEQTAEEPQVGKTYEELKALIQPLVEDGRGEEVKKLIKQYDPESTPPSIKTMPAKNHAAFEKDITALTY